MANYTEEDAAAVFADEVGWGWGGGPADEHSQLLTAPEYRQAFSVAVCSWFATNAVRLGVEASRGPADSNGRQSAATTADFSHLVPWWCRGGAAATVRSLLRAALLTSGANVSASDATAGAPSAPPAASAEEMNGAEQSSGDGAPVGDGDGADMAAADGRALLAAQAAASPSYYSVRGVPSGYGPVVPYCVPLEPSVVALSTADSASSSSAIPAPPARLWLCRARDWCVVRTAEAATKRVRAECYDWGLRRGAAAARRWRGAIRHLQGYARSPRAAHRGAAPAHRRAPTLVEVSLLLPAEVALRVAAAVTEGCAAPHGVPLPVPSVSNQPTEGSAAVCGALPLFPSLFAAPTHAERLCLRALLMAATDELLPGLAGCAAAGLANRTKATALPAIHPSFVARMKALLGTGSTLEGPPPSEESHAIAGYACEAREAAVARATALFFSIAALPHQSAYGYPGLESSTYSWDGK